MTEDQKKTRKVRTIAERHAELRESAEKAVGRASERAIKAYDAWQDAVHTLNAAKAELAALSAPTDPVMQEVVSEVCARTDDNGHAI